MTTPGNDKSADSGYEQCVLEHYRKQAETHGKSQQSTMTDETVRRRELSAITTLLEFVTEGDPQTATVLEIGCGSGVLQDHLKERYPKLRQTGLEFSPDMAGLARARELPGTEVVRGDVRSTPFSDESFDVVLSERCIINLMDTEHQSQAFGEVARVLKPGGHFVCIEAFSDAHAVLNTARQELGLSELPQPHHNLWMAKDWFLSVVDEHFSVVDLETKPELPQSNFLSSHYFISRVLYPAVSRAEIKHNTHFVKFFSFLDPVGNYSPIQVFLLRRG